MTHPIPDGALDADIAILGKKGRGKTYTAKGIVERLLEMQRRVLILDPLSVWWGLKASADGKKPGFPVAVFGGDHGDMALTEAMGRPLAKMLAGENLPAVIDMANMRKAAWQRLVADLLDELFIHNRDPLTIVLEEADVFAPQTPREGDSARVLGEVDRIARRGRAYGFKLISITQRPARLHKDVLTQLSTLVALGLSSPQDKAALKEWVNAAGDAKEAAAVVNTLAKLPVGEGWVWAPDFDLLERVRFPVIKTLDTSATPKAGETRIVPKTLAEVDLSAIRDALEVPENMQVHSNEHAAAASKAQIDKAFADGRNEGYRDGFAKGQVAGWSQAVAAVVDAAKGLPAPETAPAAPAPEPEVETAAARKASKPPTTGEQAGLSGPQRKVMGALKTWFVMGFDRVTRDELAAVAGYSRKASTLGVVLSELQRAGLVHYPAPGVVAMTTAGGRSVATLDAPDPVQAIRSLVSAPEWRVIDQLKRAGNQTVTRADLCDWLGYSPTASTMGVMLSKLHGLRLVTYPRRGEVALADWVETVLKERFSRA